MMNVRGKKAKFKEFFYFFIFFFKLGCFTFIQMKRNKKDELEGKKNPNFRSSFFEFIIKICYLTFMTLFLREVTLH